MKPVIDIVIPTYNAKPLLEKNLPHIIQNSPEVRNIIVVDNASSDNTDEYLAS
ncbi:MAG: Family 2 glycosyl transferase, partial [Parcubacteria group bacterium GW2011_GWB1_42_6]